MNKKEIKIEDEHSGYLTNPEQYALIKEERDGIHYFSIYQIINDKIMMNLIDDFEYGLVLGQDMYSHGVQVYNSINEVKIRHEIK